MRNKKLVRIQLLVLAVLTIGLVARVMIGPGSPEGIIVMTDMDVSELERATFRLETTEPFAIEATGSIEKRFDAAEPVPPLATYPWILDRTSREVVWKLDPTNVQIENATLARSSTTVTLGPGEYDVYYTTFGNSKKSREAGNLFKTLLGTHWTSDAGEWRFVMSSALDDQATGLLVLTEDEVGRWPTGDRVFWTTGSLEDYEKEELVFRVQKATPFEIYSVGEICRRNECDYGWVEEVFSRQRLWELNEADSEPAGGMAENRACRQNLELDPGLYRVVFKTDGGHAFDDWIANPPFDPEAWGLTMYFKEGTDASVVEPFDPWKTSEPLLRISGVGNDQHERVKFSVSDTLGVIVHAAGELRRNENRYDYGWLIDDAKDEKVWEMSWQASYPGGGHSGNREETAFLRLVPGTYTLHYQTDDSHAYGSWSNGTPDNPDRWGVALFTLNGDSEIQVLDQGKSGTTARVLPPPPPVPAAGVVARGPVILDARGLGNEREVKQVFTLEKATRLRVTAVGEISVSGRYDYGWLESANGTAVWEMTYPDTEPAGGDERNRKFDGVIELPPGRYIARFKTDFSHAFGDFGEDAPVDPSSWGMLVQVIDSQ